MLEGYSPVTQALLGTLFTWGLTAAGAALVFVFSSRQVIQTSIHQKAAGIQSQGKRLEEIFVLCIARMLCFCRSRVTASVFTMKVSQQLVSKD